MGIDPFWPDYWGKLLPAMVNGNGQWIENIMNNIKLMELPILFPEDYNKWLFVHLKGSFGFFLNKLIFLLDINGNGDYIKSQEH